MKKLQPFSLVALFMLFAFLAISCKKGITDPVSLDKAAGKWSINAVRMQIYYGNNLAQDSTVPWQPVVENFVNFDGVSRVKYCFNSPYISAGDYNFLPNDSIYIKVGAESEKWKILLLTNTNFNIARTTTNHTDFPGATVVVYKSFVR